MQYVAVVLVICVFPKKNNKKNPTLVELVKNQQNVQNAVYLCLEKFRWWKWKEKKRIFWKSNQTFIASNIILVCHKTPFPKSTLFQRYIISLNWQLSTSLSLDIRYRFKCLCTHIYFIQLTHLKWRHKFSQGIMLS